MKRLLLVAITGLVGLNLVVWGFAASSAASQSNVRNENAVLRARNGEGTERAPQSASGAKSVLQQLKEVWEKFTGDIAADEENDADLPPIARGKISKNDYLQLRAAYIARLRGIDPDQPFDPHARTAAIKQMEAQESIIRQGRFSELSAPGYETLVGGTWTFIGPAFLPNGQVTRLTSNDPPPVPVSGRVTAIDVDPTNPDIAYVGAAQGGVFRTLDGGATWTPLMESAQSLAIGAIAVAPSDPSKVYIGTGEGNSSIDSFFGVGIYRIDGANTASPTLVGPLNKDASNNDVFTGIAITKLLVHPANPDVILASTTLAFGGIGSAILQTRPIRGLYRSTNATQANATFTRFPITTANNGDRRVTDMVFEPGNPNNLVVTVGGLVGSDAAPDGGVYVSTNAQATTPTFTRVLTIGTTSIFRSNLAINKVGDTTTVLVATNELKDGSTTSFKNGALKVSTNIFSGSPTFTNLPVADGFCGGQCFYDIFVTMDPNNASIIYLGGSANSGPEAASGRASVFQRSTDGGATFTRIDRGLHADSHAFVITPTNFARGYFGSDGGVWRSDNVNTATASDVAWTSLNNSTFSAIQFQSIAVHPVDPNYTFGGTQDNGTEYRNSSGAWTRADGGDGGFAVIDQNATDTSNVTIYHTYFNQVNNLLGFARADSTAGGFVNFFGCGGTANGINCSDTATLFYAPLVRGPGNPNTIYYGTDRLYRTGDKGVTATVVSQAPLATNQPISAIGISPQNDNVRVVSVAPTTTLPGKVFATTSGSATMTDVSAGLPTTYVSRAVIDPNNQTIGYLTFSNFNIPGGTVWRTTNLNAASVTWASVSGSGANTLPNVPVNAFVVDPQNSNLLYAGTDIGVYFSQDSGRNWSPFATGLPRVAVFDMAITANRQLRIATHGRGMWETAAVAPDAAPSIISGKVTGTDSKPIAGVYVTLSGGRTDATATDANGNYSFTNLESNLSYTVTPSSEVFNFSPVNLPLTLDRNRTDATFTATPKSANPNQIDAYAFYVRQQYLDFLNREPDRSGLQFWYNQIASCGSDAQCIDIKRQNVSAAFFLSREFQETGFYVIRLQRVAFGKLSVDATKRITLQQFLTDSRTVGNGFIDLQPGADQVIDQNKTAYAQAVAGSAAFITRYPTTLSAAGYVDALYATAGVTPQGTERQDAINAFGSGDAIGRAATLRKIAEANSVKSAEFNTAFVLMQYFGYLRRNPTDAPDFNDSGYQFWLNKLNSFGGDFIRSEMVRSFIVSGEYRGRFGP